MNTAWLWLLPLVLLLIACAYFVQQRGARNLLRLVASLPFLAAFVLHQIGWLLLQELGGLVVRETDAPGSTDVQSPSAYVFLVGIALAIMGLAAGSRGLVAAGQAPFRFRALKFGVFVLFVALALGLGRGWWLTTLALAWVAAAWLADHLFNLQLTQQPRYWQRVGLLGVLYFVLWLVLVRYWPQAIALSPTTHAQVLIQGVPIELLGLAYGWLSLVLSLGTVLKQLN